MQSLRGHLFLLAVVAGARVVFCCRPRGRVFVVCCRCGGGGARFVASLLSLLGRVFFHRCRARFFLCLIFFVRCRCGNRCSLTHWLPGSVHPRNDNNKQHKATTAKKIRLPAYKHYAPYKPPKALKKTRSPQQKRSCEAGTVDDKLDKACFWTLGI